MARYLYALVRCVPDPRTGEFINVGAIAGSPDSGDWSIRQVSNESRVRKLAGVSELSAVHAFLARVGEDIDEQASLMEDDLEGEPLGEEWLLRLYHDHRNVVQLSPPTPVIAEDSESALDLIFDRLLIDPVKQPRGFVTKHRVLSDVREAYRRANIQPELLKRRAEAFVGDRVHVAIDFAVANGVAYQLTQGWSFQKGEVGDVATQVKAWGYALSRIRDGEEARVISSDAHVSRLSRDVDLEVVIAPPMTAQQREVYQEAEQVFGELNAQVRTLGQVDEVGKRAAELVAAHDGHQSILGEI